MLTRAGFAGARGSEETRDPAPRDGASSEGEVERTELPDSVQELLERSASPGVSAGRQRPSWSARVDARLEALTPAIASEASGDARLDAQVEGIVAQLDARVAVEIRDLQTGATLVSHDAERVLNPASNQKLVTAIAAVELLGPDYRFETTVARSGDALIIRGEGDPDLHVRDLHELAARVAARVELGALRRIIVDDGAFDGVTLGPGFRDGGPGDSYVAPSAALALDFGTVEVSVAPGAYLGPARVHVEPASEMIEVVNHARTGPGALKISTRAGEGGRTIVEVSGGISAGRRVKTVRRRVADPSLLAAATFAELLAAQAGEAAALPVERGATPDGAEVLVRHRSEPLVAVLSSALRYSNNFTAEQVLRTLAWRASGAPGSWSAGVEVLERFAAAVSPTRAPKQRFVNGSGLSHDGRLSPAFIIDVLSLADRPGSPAQTLLASFAKAGGAGTLRSRLAWAGARVMAKTGTYAGASTLSGIVHDRSGARRHGFSVLVNGAPTQRARRIQDRVVLALLRASREG